MLRLLAMWPPLFLVCLLVPAGADELCGGRVPTILGTEGNDTLVGTDGADVIDALAGDDTVDGRGGDDVICGGDGDDALSGGLGNDSIDGGSGIDSCDGYIGIDSARNCRQEFNTGLLVKRVKVPVPGGFTPVGGEFAGQTFRALDGALFIPRNSKKIAMLATHGTFGRFHSSLTGWLGWWMEQGGVAVLALNRRDSKDYGDNEGGGGTTYEDTVCDVGLGVDFLIDLGYEKVVIQGHSKGSSVAPVYPTHYNRCPGKTSMTAANDRNVAGVITTGTMREAREAGIHAPYGPFLDANVAAAIDLVARGFGGVLFPPGGHPAPGFPRTRESGPKFWAQLNFPPFEKFPATSTPDAYLSYWNNPLRDVRLTAQRLTVPYLIIHTEGDRTTPRAWSDALYAELIENGNDVTYLKQAYTSRGYLPGGPAGKSAHQIANVDARDEAIAEIAQWMDAAIPESQESATGIDMESIEALSDFDPPLIPTATNSGESGKTAPAAASRDRHDRSSNQ